MMYKFAKRYIKKGLTDFEINEGEITVLLGPSGAGKTTISALLPRLYDVTGGAIKIDGNDIRDLTVESLRDSIGVVMQDAHLFHESQRTVETRHSDEGFETHGVDASWPVGRRFRRARCKYFF